MSEPIEYAQGGYVEGGSPAPVWIHPDECLLSLDETRTRFVCRRASHPTLTSDCALEDNRP